MATMLLQNLDSFLPLLSTPDIKIKVTIGNKLFTYLDESSNSIECSDIGMFIDNIVQWLSNSNPKIIQCGIEIITQLINRMKADFKPYISTILPLTIDRLGNNKEPIKVKAFYLIMQLMECDIINPQTLFDKISTNAFNHKNSNVKESTMNLLLSTLKEFGVNCITISKVIPMIIKLLSDPNVKVRYKASETFVGLYNHIGEKLRVDLQNNYSIPQSKMVDLMNKFDKAKTAKHLSPTAFARFSFGNDETDRTCTLSSRNIFGCIKKASSLLPPNSMASLQSNSVQKLTSTLSHIGAVDENTFMESFENVPTLQIYSVRDLDNTMKKLHETIQNGNEQWNKRVDSLKRIRSLILIGATRYKLFFNNLKYLEHSFQISLKDLRSQVVRETCITIAFLSQCLGNKLNHFAESVFSNLIDLIPNSAKVIASSALITIRFILEYIHVVRVIPLLASNLGSKSKDIRCACSEFFDQILRTWPIQILEKQIIILQESIKKGIADADSNTRLLSRKAYWSFCEHFPKQGEMLLNQLEPKYHKILLTNSGSNLHLPMSVITKITKLPYGRSFTLHNNTSRRSNSAIDLQAAQRANTRTKYTPLSRQNNNSDKSSQYVTKKINENPNQSRRLRDQVSRSQPTSRSGSPSSKFTFSQSKYQKSSSGIPILQNTSRDGSSNSSSSLELQPSNKQPISLSTTKSIIKQNILMQNRKSESVLTDALNGNFHSKSPKRMLGRMLNYQSDESETSSIYSDQSIGSGRPLSDSFYWNMSQNCLQKDIWKTPRLNIEDIVSNCENTSWCTCKEGLICLQKYLQHNIINKELLKRLTDVFTKMFMDSQTKVLSLFLDVLNELIITHCKFLDYWLYILVVKLFNKEGSDLLDSVHLKILNTIETIRMSFPCDIQFISIFKFITDPTQTPNTKTKIFTMNYVSKLATNAHSESIFVSAINGKKDYITLALIKMIDWTIGNNIKQGPGLKRAAQEAILALYCLNASQITLQLSQLPEEYQEIVYRLIKFRVRRNSVAQLMSQKHQNIQFPTNLALPSLQSDTIDNFNSKESLYESPKQTTVETQHYDFENSYSEKINFISYNPEINEMSVYNKMNSYSLNGYKHCHTVSNGIIQILEDLNKGTMQLNHKKSILNHLKELIRDCPSDVHIQNFKQIIKVVLTLLMDNEPIVREQAVTLITYMVQKPEMITCFHNFTELIVMKVLNMCCDPCKPVVKVAEECSFALSVSLQPETIVKIITPLISAKEFPINLISIKMMTKLIGVYGSSPVNTQIKEIMHGLLQGYDNPDSAIRKSVVFCIVSLHKVLDKQEFEVHISDLQGAKLKILNFYIKRAQQSNSPSLKT